MMASICIYICCLFLFVQKAQPKTQPGLKICFQRRLRKCFSNFLSLAKFLRFKETVDWSKLLNLAGLAQTDKPRSK